MFVYGIKFLLGYQRILDFKGTQTFEGGRNQMKQKIL